MDAPERKCSDTKPITYADDSSGSGERYPRCEACGQRFPGSEWLERHRLRHCHGNPERPRLVRLRRPR